jgi:hypothetical protein
MMVSFFESRRIEMVEMEETAQMEMQIDAAVAMTSELLSLVAVVGSGANGREKTGAPPTKVWPMVEAQCSQWKWKFILARRDAISAEKATAIPPPLAVVALA